MEHAEVLERLRGVLEHGKMGDKCLIAPDLVTAAIASLSAPKPEGEWVLVPREPTPEMLSEAHYELADKPFSNNAERSARAYAAMLAAAPQPPAEAQPVDGLRVVTLSDAWDYAHGELSWSDLEARAVRHQKAHPPPSAPVGVKAIAAQIRASLGKGATDYTRRRWAIELETLAQQPGGSDNDR